MGLIYKIIIISPNFAPHTQKIRSLNDNVHTMLFSTYNISIQYVLKGVFAKNDRGYRLNAIKKRFSSLLILLLSVASIRRKLLKTTNRIKPIPPFIFANTPCK